MKKKPEKKMLGPTLQELEMVEVTDPAEFAELDRRCREAEEAMAAAGRNLGKKMLGPTLQESELVPITDPERLAAIDRRRKVAEKARAAAERSSGKRKSPKRK